MKQVFTYYKWTCREGNGYWLRDNWIPDDKRLIIEDGLGARIEYRGGNFIVLDGLYRNEEGCDVKQISKKLFDFYSAIQGDRVCDTL